jgi:hypothetical protein
MRKASASMRQVSAMLIALFVLAMTQGADGADLPFADAFAQRGLLVGTTGTGTGSNVGATREPDEPRHSDTRGGTSVWISWIAPTNGIVTFSTAGSSFDTLLAVYAYERELKGGPPGPPDPTKPFDGLEEIADEDDDHPSPDASSVVTFGARAGVRYEIAVDGFAGAAGQITLTWTLEPLDKLVPIILSSDADRSVRAGDTLTLSVDIQSTEDVELEWYFNGEDLEGEESTTLVITNFSRANVGEYKLEVKFGNVDFYSAPVEIQINSEGEAATLARDKLADALDFALLGDDGRGPGPAVVRAGIQRQAPPIGVTRGYNGTQIFNTVYARRDPAEPAHCGVPGTASYWFAYQPPVAGLAKLDTDGSDFDTVLAVYTYEEPFTSYASLVPVNCDNNGGPNGLTSRVEFTAAPDRTYLVVVDSANGTRGIVHLNYRLVTDLTPPPLAARWANGRPVFSFPTALGSRYKLETVPALGDTNWAPLSVANGTGESLSFTNPPATNEAGFFRVRVE